MPLLSTGVSVVAGPGNVLAAQPVAGNHIPMTMETRGSAEPAARPPNVPSSIMSMSHLSAYLNSL
jgi:hypothetical protein